MKPKSYAGPVKHKGFTIHARKKMGFPWYYAWVYPTGVKVERESEAPTREQIIDAAKWEIDQGIIT